MQSNGKQMIVMRMTQWKQEANWEEVELAKDQYEQLATEMENS